MYFYYKSVNCSYKAIQGVEEQLNTSLPGIDSVILKRKVCANLGYDSEHNTESAVVE